MIEADAPPHAILRVSIPLNLALSSNSCRGCRIRIRVVESASCVVRVRIVRLPSENVAFWSNSLHCIRPYRIPRRRGVMYLRYARRILAHEFESEFYGSGRSSSWVRRIIAGSVQWVVLGYTSPVGLSDSRPFFGPFALVRVGVLHC